MKPIPHSYYHKCPKCGEYLASTYPHCPYCGQPLDWGEGEKKMKIPTIKEVISEEIEAKIKPKKGKK